MKKLLILLVPLLLFADAQAGPIVKKTWIYAKDYSLAGDSATDDETNFERILSAAEPGWTIILDSGKVYRVTDSMTVPEYVTIEGRGAKVCFEVDSTQGGFFMKNYSSLRNMTVVTYNKDNVFPTTVHGGLGTAITVGEYDNNVGYRGVVVENVEAVSYRPRGNVIAVFSNSYADFRNVKILKNDSCGIGFMTHWAGSATTRHPSVKWDGGVIDTLSRAGARGIVLSAPGYSDIRNVDILASPFAITVQAGDSGYVKSSPTQRGTGITFTNIRSFADSLGFWVNGRSTTAPSDTADLSVKFINCYTRGVNSWGAYAPGIITEYCKNVSIIGCEITNHSYGFSDGNGYAINTSLRDCNIHNNRTRGVNTGARTTEGLLVEHCRFFNNGIDGSGIGIYIGRATNAMLFANEIGDIAESYQYTGIYIDSSGGDSNKVSVIGNHCRGYAATGYCYRVNDIDNLTWWQGNLIDTGKLNYAYPGITLTERSIISMGQRTWVESGAPADNQVPTWDASLNGGVGGWAFETPPGAGSGDDVKIDTADGMIWDLSEVIFKEGGNINLFKKASGDTVFIAASDSVMAADSAGKASADGAGLNIETGYVHSAGDTMTGELYMDNGIIRRLHAIYGHPVTAPPYWETVWIYDRLFSNYIVAAPFVSATDTFLLSTDGKYRSFLGWGLKKNATTLIMQADTTELDNGMATDAELTAHTGNASAHHTRPSAGTGLTEVADVFNVDLGTSITTDEIADSNVTGINISTAVWDSIRVGYTGGSSPWTVLSTDTICRIFAVGDTLFMYADTVNDSIHIWASHGNLSLGSTGLSYFDSLVINNFIEFSRTGDLHLDSARFDSMVNLTGRYAPGAGTTDSTRVGYGLKVTGAAGDTIAAPGDTIVADTGTQNSEAGLATKGFARDSSGGGSGLTYFTEADAGDTSKLSPASPNTITYLTGTVIAGDSGETYVTDLNIGRNADTYKLPTADGSANQILKTDGNGTISWAAETGGAGTADTAIVAWDATSADSVVSSISNKWVLRPGWGVLAVHDVDTTAYHLIKWAVDTTFGNVVTDARLEDSLTGRADDYATAGHNHNDAYEPLGAIGDSLGNYFDTAAVRTEINKLADDSANWNTAYGWGNHSGLYVAKTDSGSWSEVAAKLIFNNPPYVGNASDSANADSVLITHKRLMDSLAGRAGDYEPANANLVTDAILEDTLNRYFDTTAMRAEINLIADDTANYQTAYGWGNHSGLYVGKTDSGSWSEVIAKLILNNPPYIGNAADSASPDSSLVTKNAVKKLISDSLGTYVGGIWTATDSGGVLIKEDTVIEIRAKGDTTFIEPAQNTVLVVGDVGLTIIDSGSIGGQYIDHADSVLSKVEGDASYEPLGAIGDSLGNYFDTAAVRSAFLSKTGGDVDSIKVDTVIVDDKIVIPNATHPTTGVKGTIAIDNDDHAIEVYDSALAVSVLNSHLEDKDFVIVSPNDVNDTISIFRVGSYKYPHGIKLLAIEIYTGDSTGTYALQFEEWETDGIPSRLGYIDTLTIPVNNAEVASTTFTDSDIAAGSSIWVIVPSTVVDWIAGKITFYIKEGD